MHSMNPYSWPTPTTVHVTDAAAVRAVLAPQTGLAAQLLARAIPNSRFERGFGILSTFTSASEHVHADFTRRALSRISPHGASYPWHDIAAAARHSVEARLPVDRRTIDFDTFTQIVTLKVVLVQLLDAPDVMREGDLASVAHHIGEIWRASKSGDPTQHLLAEVNGHLRRWLPMEDNPIELVIPAYETSWRAVAHTVALANRDLAARAAFDAFMALPSTTSFRGLVGDVEFSVEMFVGEIFRLYPPTRRITRVVPVGDCPFPIAVPGQPRDITVVADIEAVQRDPAVWGATAEGFDPTRFCTLTALQKRSLLSFGHGRLSCIAKDWAPLAVAILAGAVLERVGPESEYRLLEGPRLGRRDGWHGWEVREAEV
ncbi:hypothetical protein SCP_0412290 [Sparassis crispa]|uniref:Cytochrome P450 n=1 Tax=Sparassis crispa TaxID=139825 RepID=A0A401GL19_9APHY|nr:hypothetical protein SCP_0412290 [Sparassis crispa]GBE82842.1 hypothetical protein SCP_0412290 [Sparassis crispa]